MLSGKYVSKCLLLLLCSAVFSLSMSCSDTGGPTDNNTPISETPGVMYKTYEMKPDDKRLRFWQHPLYSFEYPSVFHLIDVNKIPDYPMNYDVSDVDFIVSRTELPEPSLGVRVQPPGIDGQNNATERFEDIVSYNKDFEDKIVTEKIMVAGISADYLKIDVDSEEWSPDLKKYPGSQVLYRLVVFDYADLIWTIGFEWCYLDTDSPEVKEYFNHVIETFKILE